MRMLLVDHIADRLILILQNLRLFMQKQGYNSFAVGSDYIQGDQLAQIHNGEAIFTAAQSAGLRENVTAIMAQRAAQTAPSKPATVTINQGSSEKSESLMSEIVKELKEAKKEIIEMKDNQKAPGFAIAKNTNDRVKLLDKWDVIGLPQEQV